MAKLTNTELTGLVRHMFEAQWPMLSLYQTISDHFYPERSDFTATRNVGQELADSLVDSYPVLVRRDLGNSFQSMLRDGEWFSVGVEGNTDHAGKSWLDWATKQLKTHMYKRTANFVRATREGDHDFAAFGQCVISVELNRVSSGFLFRAWHLRDCAWADGVDGSVDTVARKWKPTYRDLISFFGDKVDPEITRRVKETPFKQAEIRHLVMPAAMYGDDEIESRFKWVSIFLDIQHDHIMEVTGLNTPYYVVPRFQTIAGSPYAYSPSTVVGLPDARALQAMTYTLLEAGERYARPPIIATQNVIRGDVDLSADGITWVDKEYDEKLGAALRTLPQDRGGFPIGSHMREGIVEVLNSAFYLDKLNLPEVTREMTAYEVAERMKQYRREVLPLFSPIESEYNGQLCDLAFDLAMNAGMLGSPYDIPDSLRERDVEFEFVSPLSASEDEKKATRFSQTSQLLAEAAQFDEAVAGNVNFDIAVRDAVTGLGAPPSWLRDPEEVQGNRQAQAEAQQAEAEIAQAVELSKINPAPGSA